MKTLFSDSEQTFFQQISEIVSCNPFLPCRIELEKNILGKDYVHIDRAWHMTANLNEQRENIDLIIKRVEEMANRLRARCAEPNISKNNIILYENMVLFLLYHRYNMEFQELISKLEKHEKVDENVDFYTGFREDIIFFLGARREEFRALDKIPHLFAVFFQIRRAFHYIFRFVIGGSTAAVQLRATIWQSIFTHDLEKYERSLFRIMGSMTTLITGPSGTGKELVARAIGMSSYLPFDEKSRTFPDKFTDIFYPLNISALSPTLVESELFGHKKGAFTGALQDKAGWFEVCSPFGSVFLDEVGEIDPSIQVKLLRVIQDRTFQRLGDTKDRNFAGKIIAATNRNLGEKMNAGTFRSDFYYRLCSDIIRTPSLHTQVHESPDELHNLILFISMRLIGEGEAETLAQEVEKWVKKELGYDYSWPGNIRELEQCVKNILIRSEYHPPARQMETPKKYFADEVVSGSLTASELLDKYCTLVYSATGSYQETARRLGIDRRTVKSRIDGNLLEELGNTRDFRKS